MESIDIIKGEVDKVREKVHDLANDIQGVKLNNDVHTTEIASML